MTPIATTEQSHVVRIRNFPSRMDIDTLLQLLQDSHCTGVVELHMSQGRIGAIKIVEKHSLNAEFPLLTAAATSSSEK
jgi:hypothetical protein